MRKTLLIFVVILMSLRLYSQEPGWQLNIFNFINNTEFGRSKIKRPQTMGGFMLTPQFGLTWDSVHRIKIGVDLFHEYGSRNAIDRISPVVYYEYHSRHIRFSMGAFPRNVALEKYPRLFFQDSVAFYRPNINGGLLEYRRKDGYINLWIDWTGRQSMTVNETFFSGLSGRLNKGILYLQHFNYLFHYSNSLDREKKEPLHDLALSLTSAGVDLSEGTIFRTLDINAGLILGMERSRLEHTGWIIRRGVLSEARIEYKSIGIFNTFYAGEGLMYFYKNYGNKLYWGDPVFRVKRYDRIDFYVNFLHNKDIDLNFTFTLHFLGNTMYQEQLLKVNVNLDFFKKKAIK